VAMQPGVDYSERIRDAIGECGALVVLMGQDWLTISDAQGRRRIDDPVDVHRLELVAALDRKVRLIPALVQDAKMPREEDLPDALKPMARRQAVELSDDRWDYDVARLVRVLHEVLAEVGDPHAGPSLTSRLRRRIRRLLIRHPGRIGFGLGAATALAVGLGVLAATGYFDAPLLRVSSFSYVPPLPTDSIARDCRVRVESDYKVRSVRFILNDNPSNSLQEETSAPWTCNNRGNENRWDTCEGHSRAFALRDDRPHRLTATVTDSQGNQASRTRMVDTNCPVRDDRTRGSPEP
jgi:hypothetical protein